MTAMHILLLNPGSKRTAICAASTSSERNMRLPCLVIAPSFCRPPEDLLARNQSQITRHLLASWKPAHVANGQHIGQRRVRAHSRLRHQQPGLRILFRRLLHRLVQLADLLVQHPQATPASLPAGMPPRVLTAARAATSVPPGSTAWASVCIPLFMERCCSSFFTRLRISTSLCRCSTSCRKSRCSRSGVHKLRKPSLHHQLQNMRRIPLVRLLLAHIAGPDLRRISDPDLVSQILHQLDEPLAVARRLHANQHRRRQLLDKTSWRRPKHAPTSAPRNSPSLRIEPRNLLPAGMEITSYNHHLEGSFLPSVFVLKQRLPGFESSLRSYPINSSRTCDVWVPSPPDHIQNHNDARTLVTFPTRPPTACIANDGTHDLHLPTAFLGLISDIMPCQLDKTQPQTPRQTSKPMRTKTSNSFIHRYFAVSASFQTHEQTTRTNPSIFIGPVNTK